MSQHRRLSILVLVFSALLGGRALAHPISFESTVTYSATQPSAAADDISQWTGAAFDAANLGGSGVNADGGANNGPANDASTYVANNQPRQGQTFTTGSNPNGYELTRVTARMAGYTGNTATGGNTTVWDLNAHNGPIFVEISQISGTEATTLTKQPFIMGGTGNPGYGTSVNGAGNYITFNLPFTTHLLPNTTYAFDFWVGNGSANFFEWLGISTDFAPDPYAGGTAYTRAWWGGPITPLSGDRVFQLDLTPLVAPAPAFAHPGALHTQADLERMKTKVTAGAEPWASSYTTLANSAWAQTGWPAYNVDYIVRGASGNNYTRSQQDAQAIYELALRWHITGDTAFADKAVQIANVWSDLFGLQGDTNRSLAAGICGYLLASGGELLSTYPGWPATEKQAFQSMMMRVFYPENLDFLWRHHDTPFTKGGNTHYRLNWDTANMASMAAIGILCDNRAVYEQAVDFFLAGPGNTRVDRAAWYIFSNGLSQTEESGRDQAHNLGGWHAMALLCQMAWNQGDDLFGYDNNRVLRAFEYNAKYNLWNEVPWIPHRNSSLGYSEGLSGNVRGLGQYYHYELVYNHYVNVKGIDAPWSRQAAAATRPEPLPNPGIHPSQVDIFGLGSLTYARDPIAVGIPPSGLVAHWSKNRVNLTWWGTAHATGYTIKRATDLAGPYTTLGTATTNDLFFTDTAPVNDTTYHYIVSAQTPSGDLDSTPLRVAQELVTRYTFDGAATDSVGTRHATLKGGVTAPAFVAGAPALGGGQAVSLNGADQHIRLPAASGYYEDITFATWVYWNGGGDNQRIFDFGTEIEKNMHLTPSAGGSMRFSMTTSRGAEGATLYGPVLPTGQWVHVAVTLNGSTGTLYVNGKPVDTQLIDWIEPFFGQPFCYLGRSMWNGDPLLNGRLDDFRIYNHALSGSEVYALWGQGGANSAPLFASDTLDLPAATEDALYGFSPGGETLAAYASDANGGTLTYAKLTGPAWLTVSSTGVLGGTPANADVGDNVFVVRVTDSTGATDDTTLRITVINTNDAPVWSAPSLTKSAVTRDQPYLTQSVAADASDVDSTSSLVWTKVSGPAWLLVASDGTLSGTPGVADVGVNTFTLRVTDDTGAFAETTLTITVHPFELRAHLAFEDNLDDSAGNYPGSSLGSPAYATGRVARGILFDGIDDVVNLPAAALDSQDLTVAAWVYWNGGADNQRIFDFGTGTNQYLFLSPNCAGGLRFAIKNGGDEQVLTTTTLATARWVHLAVTLSGDTGRLYVNGALVATNPAITINPGDFKPTANYIADSQWASDPLFNGRLDEFRVYNHALSASEIAAFLQIVPAVPLDLVATPRTGRIDLVWGAAQGASTYTVKRSLVSGGPYTVVASGLAAASYADSAVVNGTPYYYVVSAVNTLGSSPDSDEVTAVPSDLLVRLRFDENTGSVAADSTGNGWDATFVNGPAWTTGYLKYGVNLPDTAAQHLTLPAGVVSGLTDFTISSWVKVTTFLNWQRVFDFGTGTNNYLYLTVQSGTGRPRFAIRTPGVGDQGIDGSIALTAGTWTHVAVTLSGNTARLYVNGVLAGTNASTTLRPSSLGSTTQNYLGKSQWADPHLNGALDDFRIYSRALSASELVTLSTPAPEPTTDLVARPENGGARLTWTPANAATTYTIYRSTVGGGPYASVASGITTLTYADSGLVNDTTYYYVVRTVNPSGESADSAEASVTPNTLHLHLKFDETSGAIVSDSSGRAIHGTAVNAPAWTTGRIGGALQLATASSHHVTLPAGFVSTLGDCTIQGWMKITSLTNWQRVFDFGTGTDNYMFLSPQIGISPNRLRFSIRTPAVAEQSVLSSVAVPVGSWAHYAIVFSGTTCRLYLNGALVGQNTAMTLTPASLGLTTQNYLGKSQWATDPYLDSALDDFRIHSRALAASEIALFASPLAAPAGLAATPGPLELDLSWNAVPNATRYTLRYATASGGPYMTLSAGLPALSKLHSGLSYGTTYYYVVSAGNAAYDGPDSTEFAATPQSALLTDEETAPPLLSVMPASGETPATAALTSAPSVLGHVYQLQTTTDLVAGSWLDVGEPVPGTGAPLVFETPYDSAEPRRFYRILVTR